MNNLTAEQLLALIGHDSKQIKTAKDAEVYYNYHSNSISGSYSNSDSTDQQSTGPSDPTNEPVVAPTAPFSSTGASHPGMKKTKEVRKNIPRKVSTQDIYTKIVMSVNNIRIGKRTTRMTAYLSLKEENDKKLSIFLRSSLTSSLDEVFRVIRQKDNKALETVANDMLDACPSDAKILMGRLRYNPRKFKIEDEHKHNLKYGLLCIYDYGHRKEAFLWLLDEPYHIVLTDDLTEKQSMFNYTGLYTSEETEFNGDEELQ